MSSILKALNEGRNYGRDSWDSNMPGYQGDYGGAENFGRRNREWDEDDRIDARLRAQHAQKQEYERTGKFWLKLKDTQQHLPSGPFTGKQAANTAALELLKQQPELKGNLVITAYGPDEKQGVAEGQLDELSPQTLASYKKKAGADATQADKAGNFKRGDKRMSGIIKATKKEFANDSKNISESIVLTESKTYKLWESAGQKIVEAQLTQDQINQIFQHAEQIQTAGGENRTMLGRGKDAAGAVNKAWEDLKTKVQNSGPIKGVDAMYDKAAEQLKQATGGDQGVMQYVQKYRDFAKKHPVAQSLIYSALIAAAGISGAGLGGAAALGLFKMVDKLLQGEKFSSAAYQGAKTGGMAYAAGQIGQAMKGQPQGGDVTGTTDTSGYSTQATGQTGDFGQPTYDIKPTGAGDMQYVPRTGTIQAGQGAGNTIDFGGDMVSKTDYNQAFKQGLAKFAANPSNPSANDIMRAKDYAGKVASGMLKPVNESTELTESQIYLMIGKIVERQRKLDEGIMDTIKGAAGKAVDWVKTKGTNLTTKVTADKLLQAWKKAGSPTDSLDVAKIVQDAGVASDTIKQVYGNMKIPFAGEPGANSATRNIPTDSASASPAASATATPTTATSQQPADSATAQASPTASADATASAPAQQVQTTYAQVRKLVDQLDKKGKQRVITALRKSLGITVEESSTANAGLRFVKPRHVPNQDELQQDEELDENLHQWFKEKWVRFGPDGKIRGDCARGDDSEGKPKCLPQSKAQNLGKKGRASAAARKRREDPNPERSGKAINVNTKKKTNEQELDEACWKGYHKEGNKKMFGKTYPNCVKNEGVAEGFEFEDAYGQGYSDGYDGKGYNSPFEIGSNEDDEYEDGYSSGRLDYNKMNRDLDEQGVAEEHHSESCPHCGGEMVSEELMNEKKDACYYKVKSRYKVWPSAYASGALVKCRKKGASNWGNGGKSNESIEEDDAGDVEQRMIAKIAKEKQRLAKLKQTDPEAYKREMAKSKTSGRVPPVSTFEGVAEADKHSFVGKIQRGHELKKKVDSTFKDIGAAQQKGDKEAGSKAFRKHERYANLERPGTWTKVDEQGVAEDQLDEKWSQKYKDSINCSNPKGFSQKAHCAGKQKNESAIMKGLK